MDLVFIYFFSYFWEVIFVNFNVETKNIEILFAENNQWRRVKHKMRMKLYENLVKRQRNKNTMTQHLFVCVIPIPYWNPFGDFLLLTRLALLYLWYKVQPPIQIRIHLKNSNLSVRLILNSTKNWDAACWKMKNHFNLLWWTIDFDTKTFNLINDGKSIEKWCCCFSFSIFFEEYWELKHISVENLPIQNNSQVNF